MPVVECSCGMVMSVSAAKPRICCIRCGGVEFHVLERRQLTDRRLDRVPVRISHERGTGFRSEGNRDDWNGSGVIVHRMLHLRSTTII